MVTTNSNPAPMLLWKGKRWDTYEDGHRARGACAKSVSLPAWQAGRCGRSAALGNSMQHQCWDILPRRTLQSSSLGWDRHPAGEMLYWARYLSSHILGDFKFFMQTNRTDIIASIVIGEVAAILMVLIGRALALPAGISSVLKFLPIVFPLATFAAMAVGTWAGRRIPVVYQLTKFALVGGQNFLIDLGILNLLIAASGVSEGFAASVWKAIAFLVAVSSSFFWNKFWTFRSLSTERAGAQFAEFLVVSGIGLGINVAVFAFINDGLGPQGGASPELWASAAAVGAAVAGLAWNFVGYKFIVFRR